VAGRKRLFRESSHNSGTRADLVRLGIDDGRRNFQIMGGNTGYLLEGTQNKEIQQMVDSRNYPEASSSGVGHVASSESGLTPH